MREKSNGEPDDGALRHAKKIRLNLAHFRILNFWIWFEEQLLFLFQKYWPIPINFGFLPAELGLTMLCSSQSDSERPLLGRLQKRKKYLYEKSFNKNNPLTDFLFSIFFHLLQRYYPKLFKLILLCFFHKFRQKYYFPGT